MLLGLDLGHTGASTRPGSSIASQRIKAPASLPYLHLPHITHLASRITHHASRIITQPLPVHSITPKQATSPMPTADPVAMATAMALGM